MAPGAILEKLRCLLWEKFGHTVGHKDVAMERSIGHRVRFLLLRTEFESW